MKTKLILILLAAAAFGWGFSALVEHSDDTIRPHNPRLACQEWNGTGCGGLTER